MAVASSLAEKILNIYAKYYPERDPVGEADFKRILIGTGQFTKDDDERMSLLFDSFDTSGDRFISFEEFIIGAIVCTEGSFEHKAELVFKSIDTDGNRFLTHDELLRRLLRVHYLKHKGNVSQEAVQAALQEIFLIDDNKDGKISFEEWMSHAPTNAGIQSLLQPIN